MSPESVVGTVGGGISIVAVVWFLVQRQIARGDKAEDAMHAEIHAKLAKLSERLEGVSSSHRDQLEALKQKSVEHDTRLRFREGGYGANPLSNTNPGMKLTKEQLDDARRLYAEKDFDK